MLEPYEEARERDSAKVCGLLWLVVLAVAIVVWAAVHAPVAFAVGFLSALIFGILAAAA